MEKGKYTVESAAILYKLYYHLDGE